MKRLKIYFVNDDYIDYLRKFDKKVAYNKGRNRPYIGVVFTYKNFLYFAPLSSPKPKHLIMKENMVDIFKIDKGKLGIINLNNMIPCPSSVLIEAIKVVKDKKYKILIENQLTYINANKEILYKKALNFQKSYKKGHLQSNVMKRCCDFPLLEAMSLKYIDNNKVKESK